MIAYKRSHHFSLENLSNTNFKKQNNLEKSKSLDSVFEEFAGKF